MLEGPFQPFSCNQDLAKAGINLCLSRIKTCYGGNQILIFNHVSRRRKTISQLWKCDWLGSYTLRESVKPSSSAKMLSWPMQLGRLVLLKLLGRYRQGLWRSRGQEVSHWPDNSIEWHSIQISVKSLAIVYLEGWASHTLIFGPSSTSPFQPGLHCSGNGIVKLTGRSSSLLSNVK